MQLLNSGTATQEADYQYYGKNDPNGAAGDLEFVKTYEFSAGPASTRIQTGTTYYRYYSPPPGSPIYGPAAGGLLEAVIGPQTYARLNQLLGVAPSTLTNADMDLYADSFFIYDDSGARQVPSRPRCRRRY